MEFRLRALVRSLLPDAVVEVIRINRALTVRQFAALAMARLLGALGRYRNDRLPSSIPRTPFIVFVCYGNIFRSPMAEVLLSAAESAGDTSTMRVASAGLRATPGRESPDIARETARAFGVTLDEHRARLLTRELADAADVLMVMDHENEAILLSELPHAHDKLVLLGAFDPTPGTAPMAIADPYGKGEATTRACYARLQRSVRGLASALDRRTSTRA